MIIKNGKLFIKNKFEDDHHLVTKKQIIKNITIKDVKDNIKIDASGCYVVPGFIDIHTHGLGGYDVNQVNKDDMEKLANIYIKEGTTSVLPSTVSQPMEKTYK